MQGGIADASPPLPASKGRERGKGVWALSAVAPLTLVLYLLKEEEEVEWLTDSASGRAREL